MTNRQLYTMKFMSSRLKKFDYDIEIDYKQALSNGEIIALSDSQMLRTIRDVVFKATNDKNRVLDRDELERFYENIEELKRKKNSKENIEEINKNKNKIINMCFIPEYITIIIEHENHYDELYENGLKINGTTYHRISVSAGQGRVSTVTFCSDEIMSEVNEILDNGRNKDMPFSPSKFNAYKGTYCSATKVVTTPRFCVVPDYESPDTFMVNLVTENESLDEDDTIEQKEITKMFNRWDGMGLISPKMAEVWSKDLNLDYIPSQFCVRQSYIKGLLNVFDIHEFCRVKNNGIYTTKSIYKDKNGENIIIDLRDYDVILTESQFKLWNSYKNLDVYKENCNKNNLKWGVSLYTDKELNNTLKMNYQFLQVNNIKKEDIPELCNDFVEWIEGVNAVDEKNIYYTLLFLLGKDVTKSSIESYLKYSNNYWVKSLIVNKELIHDKYIKQKIYNLIKTKIENACLGAIYVRGNYQPLVSDPYGMMEYLCGLEVKGLLSRDKYYSNYWNNVKDKDGNSVKKIIGMRAPLTYRSEIVNMELDNTEEQRYWYQYNYGGIIVNIHGHETDNWAGSDWDFDILATSDNNILVNSTFKNEYPVVYEAPKPKKIIFTDRDLFESDKFTFGSIIGAITNKSTSGVALLPFLEEIYGINSLEYKTTLNRVKMCTKLQSAQIDKAKIGQEVKGIPKTWTDRKYIDSLNTIDDETKKLFKRILLDRHPRFFIHLYPETKAKYKKHIENYELSSIHKFGITLNDILLKENRTQEENKFVESYYEFMPVIDSNSVMNNICRYIESIDFKIRQKIKSTNNKDLHLILMRNETIDDKIMSIVLNKYKEVKKEMANEKKLNTNKNKNNKYDDTKSVAVSSVVEKFKESMESICSDISLLVDCLIKIFYVEFPSSNKELLWSAYGKYIFENIIDKNKGEIMFPFPNKNGSIRYLNDYFELMEVDTKWITNTTKKNMEK